MKKKYLKHYTLEEYIKNNLIKLSIALFIGLLLQIIKHPIIYLKEIYLSIYLRIIK